MPFLPPGCLPHPGIEPTSLTSPALSGGFCIASATWEGHTLAWKMTHVGHAERWILSCCSVAFLLQFGRALCIKGVPLARRATGITDCFGLEDLTFPLFPGLKFPVLSSLQLTAAHTVLCWAVCGKQHGQGRNEKRSSSVVAQPLSRVRLFATPWAAAHQASLSFTISQSSLKLMSTEPVMPSTVSFSVVPFSSCLQSFPASGSFPVSQRFASHGQSIGASAAASVLPKNIQGGFPLGLTGLISLQSKSSSGEVGNYFTIHCMSNKAFFSLQLESSGN